MVNIELKNKIEEIKDKFIERCSDIVWRRKGIFFSEGLAFCAYCELYDIKTIVESGVRNGVSTEIWANYFRDEVQIFCVDLEVHKEDVSNAKSIFTKYKNINYFTGNGLQAVPTMVNYYPIKDTNTAVLLDGPKEWGALEIATKIFPLNYIKFAAIHDMGAGALIYSSKPTTKPSIEAMRRMSQYEFCTDESEFINNYWYMNDKLGGENNEVWTEYKRRYYMGCGLAFLVNQ